MRACLSRARRSAGLEWKQGGAWAFSGARQAAPDETPEKNVFIFMDTGRVHGLAKGTRDSKASCRKCLRPGWRSKPLGARAPPASRPHPMHPLGDLGEGPLPGGRREAAASVTCHPQAACRHLALFHPEYFTGGVKAPGGLCPRPGCRPGSCTARPLLTGSRGEGLLPPDRATSGQGWLSCDTGLPGPGLGQAFICRHKSGYRLTSRS